MDMQLATVMSPSLDPNSDVDQKDANGHHTLSQALLAQHPARAQMDRGQTDVGGSGVKDDLTGRSGFNNSDDDTSPPREPKPSQESIAGEEEPFTIKCICSFPSGDGGIIFCETCETWQHIECYHPDQTHAATFDPDFPHSCVDCEPRPLDRQRAIACMRVGGLLRATPDRQSTAQEPTVGEGQTSVPAGTTLSPASDTRTLEQIRQDPQLDDMTGSARRGTAGGEESTGTEADATDIVMKDGDSDIQEEDEALRCVCGKDEYQGPPPPEKGFKHGSGHVEDVAEWFVQCDVCKVWQHGGCVGMTEESCPDEYFCERCRQDLHQVWTASNG